MITKQTAHEILLAYQDIENGESMLKVMQDATKEGSLPEMRDAFGKLKQLQLGIPSSPTSTRLIDVHPKLAIQIIKAHVAEKQAALQVLGERVKTELGMIGVVDTPEDTP